MSPTSYLLLYLAMLTVQIYDRLPTYASFLGKNPKIPFTRRKYGLKKTGLPAGNRL